MDNENKTAYNSGKQGGFPAALGLPQTNHACPGNVANNVHMSYEIEIENKVIREFVRKDKQERYLAFIKKPDTRIKFLRELAHFKDLKVEIFESISGNIKELIKHKISVLGKLDDCYVISENHNTDGQRISITDALDETIGYTMGTILVFGNAEIIYYEGEQMKDRLISTMKK